MKILIIDNEIPVASLLADAVTQQGHEVVLAHEGREGLALLGRHRPDAVFLDMKMPEMGGLAVFRSIRTSNPGLPVIVITGHASADELAEARRLGVTEMIEKPSVLNRVTEALAHLGAGR